MSMTIMPDAAATYPAAAVFANSIAFADNTAVTTAMSNIDALPKNYQELSPAEQAEFQAHAQLIIKGLALSLEQSLESDKLTAEQRTIYRGMLAAANEIQQSPDKNAVFTKSLVNMLLGLKAQDENLKNIQGMTVPRRIVAALNQGVRDLALGFVIFQAKEDASAEKKYLFQQELQQRFPGMDKQLVKFFEFNEQAAGIPLTEIQFFLAYRFFNFIGNKFFHNGATPLEFELFVYLVPPAILFMTKMEEKLLGNLGIPENPLDRNIWQDLTKKTLHAGAVGLGVSIPITAKEVVHYRTQFWNKLDDLITANQNNALGKILRKGLDKPLQEIFGYQELAKMTGDASWKRIGTTGLKITRNVAIQVLIADILGELITNKEGPMRNLILHPDPNNSVELFGSGILNAARLLIATPLDSGIDLISNTAGFAWNKTVELTHKFLGMAWDSSKEIAALYQDFSTDSLIQLRSNMVENRENLQQDLSRSNNLIEGWNAWVLNNLHATRPTDIQDFKTAMQLVQQQIQQGILLFPPAVLEAELKQLASRMGLHEAAALQQIAALMPEYRNQFAALDSAAVQIKLQQLLTDPTRTDQDALQTLAQAKALGLLDNLTIAQQQPMVAALGHYAERQLPDPTASMVTLLEQAFANSTAYEFDPADVYQIIISLEKINPAAAERLLLTYNNALAAQTPKISLNQEKTLLLQAANKLSTSTQTAELKNHVFEYLTAAGGRPELIKALLHNISAIVNELDTPAQQHAALTATVQAALVQNLESEINLKMQNLKTLQARGEAWTTPFIQIMQQATQAGKNAAATMPLPKSVTQALTPTAKNGVNPGAESWLRFADKHVITDSNWQQIANSYAQNPSKRLAILAQAYTPANICKSSSLAAALTPLMHFDAAAGVAIARDLLQSHVSDLAKNDLWNNATLAFLVNLGLSDEIAHKIDQLLAMQNQKLLQPMVKMLQARQFELLRTSDSVNDILKNVITLQKLQQPQLIKFYLAQNDVLPRVIGTPNDQSAMFLRKQLGSANLTELHQFLDIQNPAAQAQLAERMGWTTAMKSSVSNTVEATGEKLSDLASKLAQGISGAINELLAYLQQQKLPNWLLVPLRALGDSDPAKVRQTLEWAVKISGNPVLINLLGILNRTKQAP